MAFGSRRILLVWRVVCGMGRGVFCVVVAGSFCGLRDFFLYVENGGLISFF